MLLSLNESIWLCRYQGRCGERPVGRFIGGARIQKEAFAQGRADKLYAQRHPARRQLSGDHEGRDSGDAEQIDQRPARCEGLLRGVYGRGVEKATGSSRKSTWSEAKKASTCLERACLWSRAA